MIAVEVNLNGRKIQRVAFQRFDVPILAVMLPNTQAQEQTQYSNDKHRRFDVVLHSRMIKK